MLKTTTLPVFGSVAQEARVCAIRDCASNQAYASEGLKWDGDERIANMN